MLFILTTTVEAFDMCEDMGRKNMSDNEDFKINGSRILLQGEVEYDSK